MADQKLIATLIIFRFLLNNFLQVLINLQFLEKVNSLVHFDYFFLKARFYDIIYQNF